MEVKPFSPTLSIAILVRKKWLLGLLHIYMITIIVGGELSDRITVSLGRIFSD